ncbi:MAG: alpha/beta hydrolase [Proteobacteria bacterium]|nr:alpha/beta hydrolase [Pseudomonadota bacterium]
MRRQKFTVTGGLGAPLSVQLDMPDEGTPQHYAIYSHCYTCSKNLKSINNIAHAMADSGWGFVRFDFTGIGESGGEFINTNFASDVADINAVLGHMRDNAMPVQLLIGHSLGGAASIQAASESDDIKAVATIGAPFHRGDVSQRFLHLKEQIESTGSAEIEIGGQRYAIGERFISDADLPDLDDALKKLKAAILIMHAPEDKTVDVENASRLFMAAHHSKSFVSLADADHLLTNKDDALYVGRLISTWAGRYIT